MAGDWIKVEKATPRKPEVLRISELLGVHPDHAFGLCVRFWFWCDDQLKSCHAKSVTNVTLDFVVGHTGFANALLEVGWLHSRNGSIEVPNFDRHLSESAKKRAESLRRKQKQRHGDVTDSSRKKCDKSGTREEIEKSKSINKKTNKKEAVDRELFEKWWRTYPRKKSKEDAFKAYCKAVSAIARERGVELVAAQGVLQSLTQERVESIQKHEAKYQPYPATWLNAGGYYDEVQPNLPLIATAEMLANYNPTTGLQ